MKQFTIYFLLPAFFLFSGCSPEERYVELKPGMVITESVLIKPKEYAFNGSNSLDEAVILIRGNDITVDFQGATLRGSNDKRWPDQFYGLAIRVENSTNVNIKNLRVHGYKVGLMAENVDSLKLGDSDFSYNYRQKLKSTREREDLSDLLNFQNNDKDEWLRYGAAVYLKSCDQALVKNIRVTGGQNGLLMTACDDGLFYNNAIRFNSAVGIGMYRSSRNRIMHNRLDWNVRGYSHNVYNRDQDSAGILCYEQSNDNIFAYNSATHSGDGFFLWAGKTTIDSGEGGCNNNIVYKNDFSYAPSNAVEVTFSKNQVIANILNQSTCGIWGAYSFGSIFANNEIRNNTYGIAVEHGQENDISNNNFVNNEVGVRLGEMPQQSADWGYSRIKDIRSRDHRIEGNGFENNDLPLQINESENIKIENNHFASFQRLLDTEDLSISTLQFINNTVYQTQGWSNLEDFLELNTIDSELATPIVLTTLDYANPIMPLIDGMETFLDEDQLRGRSYILMNEWGPYDFSYPVCWLRDVEGEQYTFLMLGPAGNWRIVGAQGFENMNVQNGEFPATLIAQRSIRGETLSLVFEFIGEELTDQFGKSYAKDQKVTFSFRQ